MTTKNFKIDPATSCAGHISLKRIVSFPFPLGRVRTAAEKRQEIRQFDRDVKIHGRTKALHLKWMRAKIKISNNAA